MSFASLAIAALLSTAAVSATPSNDAVPATSSDAKEQQYDCCDRMKDQQHACCAHMAKSHAAAVTNDPSDPPGGGA